MRHDHRTHSPSHNSNSHCYDDEQIQQQMNSKINDDHNSQIRQRGHHRRRLRLRLRRRRIIPLKKIPFIIVVVMLLVSFLCMVNLPIVEGGRRQSNKDNENLYNILGVSKSATTKEIKQAYRRKALDTHPDKNKGIPPEKAAEAFHKVVHAFEILSDDQSRQRYDQTGYHGDNQGQSSQSRQSGRSSSSSSGFSWSFSWSSSSGGGGGSSSRRSNSNSNNNQQQQRQRQRYQQRQRQRKLKDKFEVKEAQSRVLHIVSLAQLETIIVNDDDTDNAKAGTLERNLLICFYTPPLEEHVNDEMVYPWPFAAMSSQGIWWEDLLQTTSIRFHRSNELTKFFNISDGTTLRQPIFVFGKRGTRFDKESAQTWSRLETNDREVFDDWVWDQIKVQVEFINHHDHPVEFYWIHGTKAKISATLQPGESHTRVTMLSHEWWVRDARTDTHRDSPGRWKLTDNSMLIKWKIVSDEHKQKLIVPKRTCYDISGHCGFWANQGECKKNPKFMEEQCRLTCDVCTRKDDEEVDDDEGRKNEQEEENNNYNNGNEGHSNPTPPSDGEL